jgi:hypothetical protein
MYALARERVYTCYISNDVFAAICCNGKLNNEPLSSNERLAPASIFLQALAMYIIRLLAVV